jgi:eukaryotic-like serine/threonine-protein kinase
MHVPDPHVGTVLHDRYLVLERVTEGSMGIVYRGERVGLKRPVAIKFLNEGYAGNEDGVRRFEVEARAMSRLAHPNCVAVTDFGLDQGAPYLVMDFVNGQTLRQILNADTRVPPVRAVSIVRQILAGLIHAHEQGIIHRDIKPENILVTPVVGHGEHVRIVDFGLAKLRDESAITTGRMALGTPGYMSPEQTIGDKVDERADVYGVGIILYELLTGQKPFRAKSAFDVMRMHREVPPPPMETIAPDLVVSPGLTAVVARALEKAREDRFPTAAAFLDALGKTREAHGKTGKSNTLRNAGIAAAVVVVAIGLWLWRSGSGAEAPAPSAAAVIDAGEPAVAVDPGPPPAPVTVDAAVADAPPDAAPEERKPDRGTLPAEPSDVAKLRSRAARGEVAAAIRGLEALRSKDPKRAAVHYALGNLYAELQRWPAAVDAYSAALARQRLYRNDAALIGDVVEALASDAAAQRASRLILDVIGKAALPRLNQATRSSNATLRTRARGLRMQLAPR